MADPREELVVPLMSNEPGFLPPGHVGEWPRGTPYRVVEPEPSLPPMQGRAPLEPDLSPGGWKPPRTPWQDAQALGGLVKRGFGSFFAGPPAENRQRFEGPYTAPQTAAQGAGAVLGALVDPARRAVESQQTRFDPNADPLTREQAREAGPGAAAEVGMNLVGINAPFAATRSGTAGVFGGRLSKGFDPNREKLAATMEQNGIPPQQIWKETGMVKFADGKWAHEIPDIGASYKGDVDSIARRIFDQKYPDRAGTYGTGVMRGNMARSDVAKQEALLKMQGGAQLYLPDVIDHPQLFAAYPELRKMPVSQDAFMHAQGVYYPESVAGKDIQPRNIKYREENQPGKMARGATFDTLLHEIQHAIQQIEGMAKGSSTHQMLSIMPGTGANKIFTEEMKKFAKPLSEQEYLSKYPATTKKEYADYMDDYRKRLSKHEDFAQQFAAEQAYPRSAGENVAELPPQRKSMTPEQLAAVYPPNQFRVPMEQQFVEFNRLTNPAGTSPQAQMGGILKPRPTEFWRGENVGDPRRISTGNEAWDKNFFLSSDKDSASMYGKTLTRFEAAPDAKILYEGSPEWRKIAGQPRKNENLLDYSVRAAEAAKAAGYDAAHFTRQGDVGTVVFNRDKFVVKDPGGFEGPQMSAGPVLRGKAAEEAWRGTEKDPKLRTTVHPYSNVGGTPIREMESPIIKGALKAEPRKLDVEKDLTNAELIFTGGDATGAGGMLYGSKSLPFEHPVRRFGGPGYASLMQGKKVEGHPGASPVWASMKAPMGEIFNIASDVERRGKVPWQVYMTGGKQYLDSSLQMVDTAVQAAKAKGVSERANEYLFNVMRSDWNTAADPNRLFPKTGLKNEKAMQEWIDNSPQPQRAKLVKAMDSVTARSLGFPDIGQLRVWNTDPRALTAPPGSAGLAMARIDPKAGLIPSHHPSYNTAIAGTDVGTLGMQVPHQIIAPTMHESRMSTLNKPQYYTAAPHLYFPGGGTRATKTEPVTNKLKDILQRWMLDNPGGLAVAGTAGGLGSLVAPRQEVY